MGEIFVKLIGDGIYLRFLEEADAPAMLDLRQRNRKYFEPFLVTQPEEFYTLDYQLKLIQKGLALMEDDQCYSFGIFMNESDELIGAVTLSDTIRGMVQSCFIGYYLDQKQNGRGYMTQAVKLVVDDAFNVLHFHRVEAGVMPHNTGSKKVLEKVGFEVEGLNRKNVKINGKWEDHVHFAMINPND